MTVGPALAEDLDAVRALLREYQTAIGVDLCFQNFERELAELPGAYAPPMGRLLVARTGGVLAGCVAVRPLAPEIAEMKRLDVRPAFLRRGLGRALAVAVIDEARQLGYRTMRLDTLPTMQSAHALYRSLGFTPIAAFTPNPTPGTLYFERAL